MWLLFLPLVACTPDPGCSGIECDAAPDAGSPDTADSEINPVETGETGESTHTDDSASEIVPDTTVDVIVIGSGPAGCAAALDAEAAGAQVMLFEREESPGLGLVLAGLAFGVNTDWQAEGGVTDSVAIAAAEWSTMTGASGESASVQQYLAQTPETLRWLESRGATITGAFIDADAGELPRIHLLTWPIGAAFTTIMDGFSGEVRLGVEVVAPWLQDGVLRGVRWHNLDLDTYGYTAAPAVVVATGGFLRNRDKVDAVAPELAGRNLLFETNLSSDGGGLPFLDAVAAGSLSPDAIGLYVHSIPDPAGAEGEALIAALHRGAILIDSNGERFVNETGVGSLDIFAALPTEGVFALTAGQNATNLRFKRPAYNWASELTSEDFGLEDVETLGSTAIYRDDTLASVAAMAGFNPVALQAEVDAFNVAAATGTPDAFGRTPASTESIEGAPYVILELTPGLAKAFGGVATGIQGEVLNQSGEVVPGLYAAGEVVGMITGGGGGDGFSGSVSACYGGGRIAGANAASYALSR